MRRVSLKRQSALSRLDSQRLSLLQAMSWLLPPSLGCSIVLAGLSLATTSLLIFSAFEIDVTKTGVNGGNGGIRTQVINKEVKVSQYI